MTSQPFTECNSQRRYDWVFWQDDDGLWHGMTTDGEIVLGSTDSYGEIVKVAAVVLTQLGRLDDADVLECWMPATLGVTPHRSCGVSAPRLPAIVSTVAALWQVALKGG
jgi:hypothetical protein